MRTPEQIADAIMATVCVVQEDADWLRGLLVRAAREGQESLPEEEEEEA